MAENVPSPRAADLELTQPIQVDSEATPESPRESRGPLAGADVERPLLPPLPEPPRPLARASPDAGVCDAVRLQGPRQAVAPGLFRAWGNLARGHFIFT
eukprot:9438460-Alexandrium_andersonii.AAC.1